MSLKRIVSVVRKEVREFRRNRFVIGTMAVLPVVFLITVLGSVLVVNLQLRLMDVAGDVRFFNLDGTPGGHIATPGLGSVSVGGPLGPEAHEGSGSRERAHRH